MSIFYPVVNIFFVCYVFRFTPDQVESGKFGALNSGSHILGKIKNVDITVEGKTVYANLMVAGMRYCPSIYM